MWFDPQTLLARSYPPATSATFEVQAGTKVAESQKSQGLPLPKRPRYVGAC